MPVLFLAEELLYVVIPCVDKKKKKKKKDKVWLNKQTKKWKRIMKINRLYGIYNKEYCFIVICALGNTHALY